MIKNTIFRYVLLFFFPLLVSLNSYALDCTKIQLTTPSAQVKYCDGQDVNLTTTLVNPESGTAAYKWYYNNTVITPDVTTSSYSIPKIAKSKAGTYKCEVILTKTGETPCTTSVEIDVVVIDKFSFDLGADQTMCPGTTSIPLTPTIQNSNSSIIYSWTSIPAGITGSSKDLTVTNAQVTSQSTLTLTATFGNCVFSDNVKVINLTNLKVDAGLDQSVCKGSSVNLTANISGNNGISTSYSWTGPSSFNSTIQSPSILNFSNNGDFVVKGKVNTCEVSDIQKVFLIQAILSSDDLIEIRGEKWIRYCLDGEIKGTIYLSNGLNSNLYNFVDQYEINWGDGSPLFTTSQDNFQAVSHSYLPGLYTLKFKVNSSTCTNITEYKVFIGTTPGSPGIEIQPDPHGCAPKIDWFLPTSNSVDSYGTSYLIEFNDGKILNYDYPLPDTIRYEFKKTSCGIANTIYGPNRYGVKITSRNACDTSGVSNSSSPIYISEPLVADLDIPIDTICINKSVLIQNKTVAGINVNAGNCSLDYKHFWTISPSTNWSSTSNLGNSGTPPNLTGPYNSWLRGDNEINVNFTKAGLYYVTITSKSRSQCPYDTKTKTICVEEPPIPKFELDKLVGCAPFTPLISELSDISKSCKIFRKWEVIYTSAHCVPNSGSYEFIDGTSNKSLIPKIKFNSSGNYTIRLKLANTCDTVWYDQQIKVIGLPIVSIPTIDSICKNGTVNPTVSVNPCENTITGYSWTFNTGIPATSTNQTPGAITYNTDGSKTIQVVVNSGCGNVTASQTFYVKTLPPVLNPKINNQSPTVTVCIGDNVNFTSASMPRTPAIYNWTGPNGYTNTNQNFSFVASNVNQAGIYKVKGTMNGCAGPEESVTLVIKTKPTLTITPSYTEICKNTSTSLVASGTTTNTTTPTWVYTWSPNTSLSATTGATVTANPTATITYTLTGSDGICSNTKTVLVTVKELPVINNSQASQTICSETATSPVTWTSTMASTYSWSISSNTGNVTGVTTSGTGDLPVMTLTNPTFVNQTLKYNVIAKSNGCDGTAFEYTIIVKPKPNLTISPFTKTTYCGGEKITVPTFTSSVAGATFQWTLTTPNPVPSVITGVTTNHTGTGQMADLTINNSGTDPVSFTYTVKSIANVCEGNPSTFSFTIFPAPSIQPLSKTTQEICSETNSEAIPFSSLTANVKYIWKFGTIPTGLSAPSKLADSITGATSFSIPSFPFTNSTANPLSVDVVVKAATLGTSTCPGQTRTHTITVNPKPNVIPTTPSQLICNTQNTTAINFSSTTNLNMSYSWVNSNTSIGLVATGTGNIATFVAANSTKDVKVATITVTPIYSTVNKTCNGVLSNAIIKVLPTPEVNPITSQVKCPLDNTDEVTPNINPAPGSTFSWTLTGDKPNTASALSGTGAISSVVAENSGATIKTGTYNVTPTFTFEGKACTGPVLPFTIKVLPKPSISPISNQEKCSNTNNDPVNFVTSPATDVVINWQNDLAIGIPTPGTGNISSMKLTNATTSPVTSNFTAKPSFTNSGKTCVGDDKTFTIKVNPIPTVNPVADISICPEFNQAAIPFTSPVAGTTYSWVSTGDNIGLSASSGTGNIPSFTSVNTSDVIKTANIQVTPTASTCPGPVINFNIIVKPKPRITNSPLSQEVCSGDKNRPIVWTSSVNSPAPTYSWTSSSLSSGLTITPPTGTGNIPDVYQFVNTGTSPISVKFTVKATVASCESTPTDYTLTVNPRPVLSDVVAQAICSGSTFTTPTFTSNITANTTYTWAVKTTPPISSNLTGYTATGSGPITGVVLTNAANSPQNLVYTITPSAYTCAGQTKDFTIQVNPTPMVTFSIPNQTICNTTTTQVVNVTPLPSDASISWSATVPAAISGFTTLTGTGAIPASILTTNSTSPSEITIQARASTTGTAVCPGISREHKITVIPTPVVTATNDLTVCTGNIVNAVTFSGTATRFDWTNSVTTLGLTAASGSASVPQFTASNTGVAPTNTTIRVTPKYELNTVVCTGNPDEYVITVNPRPVLNNLTELTRCNREIFSAQTFTSNIPATTYTWTNSTIAIGLNQNGTVSIPTFTATNSTNATLTGNVVVTPTFTNNTITCNGDTKNVNYIVKPTARISNLDTKDSICSGEFSKAVQWNTNITATGTTYTWQLMNAPDSVNGHQVAGTGNLFYSKVFNKAKTIRSLIYKVSPTYSGCLGDTSFLYTLYINPAPGLTGVSDQTICGGTSTVASNFVSDVVGTVFNWTLTNKSSVPATLTGYIGSGTASGTGNIAATVINNAGTNSFDLLYDIATNGSSGCGGSSQQLKITVNPAPTLNPIAAQTICSGQSTTAITLASVTPGVSYKWDVISGGENLTGLNTVSGTTNSIPAYTLAHTTPNIQVVKILAFAKTAGLAVCEGRKDTIKITVNPIPVLSAITSQIICSGATFTTPTFTSTVIGNTSYTWAIKNPPTVSSKLTGYTATGTGNILGLTLTNIDSIPQSLIYNVTPSSYGCSGTVNEFSITVNPVPIVRFSLPDQTICNEATTQKVTITPKPINATIAWTATVPAAITGFSSLIGTVEIPAYKLTNSTNLPAEITVTARASTIGTSVCQGTVNTYKISVIPTPTVTPTNDLTVCSGNSVNAVTFSGTATQFDWTNSLTTLGLLPASGVASVSTFTAINSGIVPIKTTITVTPKYVLNTIACSGIPDQYDITVNPRPILNDLTQLTKCNKEVFQAQTFSSNISTATYTWTNSNVNIGLAATGSNSIPTFTSTNITDAILTSNIVVTPTFTNNAITCNGDTKNVNYIVKPTAKLINTDNIDSICSGEFSKGIVWNTNITAAGTTYTWKLINSPDSVSGYDVSGSGNFSVKKITNKAKTIRSLVYKISPTYSACLGDTSFIYTLYINPAPGLNGVTDQTICGGTSTLASVFVSDVIGTNFNWILTNKSSVPSTITGFAGSTTANGTGNIPASVITNSGTTSFDLLYDVATNSSSGCSGASQELKITVNPSPVLNPVSVQTICSGQGTNAVTLSSSTTGVSFKWDVISGAGNVVGITTLTGLTNTIPSYTISHTKLSKQVVKILAFAKTSGLAVCDGRKDTIYLNINPIPALNPINDIVLCKDENTSEVVFSGNGTNYKWVVTNSALGLSNGNGLKINSFSGINTTVAAVSSNITVTPEFTDIVTCLGEPKNFTITVNPKPIASPVTKVVVCHNEDVILPAFNSTTNGVVFKWYNNLTSINLASSGTGNIQTFKATNTSNSASIQSKIKVVPFYTNLSKECKGDTMPFTIKVNPIPIVNPVSNIVLCNDSVTPQILFTGTASSYDWYNKNSNIGLAAQGTGNIDKFKSINTTALPIISELKAVPVFTEDLKSCKGDTAKFTIKVNPTPLLTIPAFDTLCYDQNTKRVEFSSNIPGSTFSWINTTPGIVSGLGASGNTPINSFKGLNSSHVQQVSIAEVTTTSDGCPSKKSNYKIIINPKASIIDVPNNQEICSGVLSSVVSFKSDVLNTTTFYNWVLKSNPYKVAITKTFGTGSLPAISMVNDSSRTAEVVFSVVPTAYGCIGDTFLYTYKVLPRPRVKLIPAQVICGGSTYTSPVFYSDVSNTVFTWKLRDSLLVPPTISGYLKSGVAILPSKTIENTGVLPYELNYDVSTSGAGCSGQSIEFKLTIKPAPKVMFDLQNQTICNASNTKEVIITSVTPDAFFEWSTTSIPDSLLGVNVTAGTNKIGVYVLSNTSIKPIDLKIKAKAYTMAGTLSCYGKDSIYTITVNPVAKAKDVLEQKVCHGLNTNEIVIPGTGTSYNWFTNETAVGLNPTSGVNKIPVFKVNQPDTSLTKKIEFYVQPKYTHQGLTCDGIKDTIHLTMYPKPIIEVASPTICLGKKATLKGFGAAFNASYLWSPGTGLSCTNCLSTVASPENTTVYTVIGINRYGCKDTTNTTVFVNPLPKVNAGPDTTLCRQPIPHTMVGMAEGVVKPGYWSGSTDLTVDGIYTPTLNGVYNVVYQYILPTGCENFDTTIVTVKDVTKADAGPDLIACFNDLDVQLNGIPQPGTWTGFNVSTKGIFKPIKDTLVPLVFTIGKGTCLNRDTMLFKVHPDFIINAGADKEFCFSDAVFDFVTQNYIPSTPTSNGTWKGNGIVDASKGSFSASIAGVGKHPIVFSYTHPITGCIKQDTLIAEVHPLPDLKFKIDSIVCLNSTHTILNTTKYLKSSDWTIDPKWKYTDKDPTHKFDSVGFINIRLIATSPFGCIDSLTKNIEVREAPVARFTRAPDSTCGLVSFVNLSEGIGVTYDWNFGNGDKFDKRDPADLIYKPGIIKDTTYTIKLIIENMCGVDSMSLPIVVKPVPKIIFAPNVNEGCSVLPIVYANKTVGLPDEIKWDFFGDGNFVESKDSLIYKNYSTGLLNSTTYNIKVIAVNECGSDTAKTSILVHPNTVKAHFNPDRIEGCTDLSIKFTQYSMGNNFHIWNFGDGTSSKDIHPTHVYSKPGKYNVYLAVSNGCSKDTMRATINVYQTPKIDFVSSKDSLCLKGAFAFKTIRNLTDQFTYRWIFGDGDTSFVENPTHTYLNAGKYTINLQVSNVDNYCSAYVEHPVYVKPRPIAAFSMDTTQGCSPVFVKFKNTSIGANFHSWNFGDGTITNIIESDHLFKTVLKDTLFEVKLIVENASSCKDTFTSKVHVFPVPIMNFTYTPSDQCYTPMYADFTNTSIGAQSYKWYFHDNMTSVELNPTMVYQLPGKYIVKLEGENEFRCMSSISHEVIKYPKPKADFTSDKKDGCVPLSISLTNKSQGASKYSWDFGDGNAKNTTDATTIYPIAGKYNVRLIVENSDKCKDTLILPIEAFPVPTPNFVFQRSDTCATPMVTNFTNTSTGALYYDWDFDNGLVATITNPKTTYTIPKDYNVKLIATNEYNCSISIQKTVTLLQKPAAEFTTNINIGCIPLVIDFKNTSTFGKYYSWQFDDGNVSNQQDTKHIFKTSGQDSIKKFQVKLIVEGSNGCKDTIEHAITTMPLPVPNFTYMTTDPCYNPMNAYFQNNSLYAKKYDWIFGNGQLSTETNPAANYLKAGVYNVDLIATNKFECKDTIRKTVQMNQKPKAQFSMDKDKGCIPLSVSFLNESLYANYSKWNFDDGNNSANTSTNNLFTKVGELNIELIVENTLGCKDTVRHKLTTFPIPVPAFNFTTTDPCYIPMITQFNNQSTGAVGYAWNFGNNQTSNLDNPSVKYDASNVYKVKLDAINEYACTTSVSKFVTVNNRPKSDFYSDKVEGCMPLKVDFTNKSIGYKFLNWNFGDTNYSTAENPNHVFLKDGKYQINLVTENSIGCKDTIAKTILVHPLPVAKFSITNSDPCFQPMEVKTYNQSTGATNYDWDFGDAITSFETHPIVNYTTVNNHLIVLNAKNEYGCLSTAKQFIRNYHTPKLTPKELPSGFCEWDQLFYSINSLFVNKITWDMGNGAKKEGGTINYTYKKQGNYTITVIGEGEGGCADTVVLTQQIIVHPDPVADFNAEGIKIDDLLNGTMVFKNASKQADYYTWFFGDGDTSNVNSPTHKFHHSGDFSTTLIATNSYKCVDTITKTIHVDFFKGLYVANAIYLGHQDFQVSHFLPKGVGLFEYEITIYDDWGNLIWRSTAIDEYGRPTEAWDGTYKGEFVQQDSYVWKVNAIFRDNSVWEGKEYQPTIYKRAGTVTVIK